MGRLRRGCGDRLRRRRRGKGGREDGSWYAMEKKINNNKIKNKGGEPVQFREDSPLTAPNGTSGAELFFGAING